MSLNEDLIINKNDLCCFLILKTSRTEFISVCFITLFITVVWHFGQMCHLPNQYLFASFFNCKIIKHYPNVISTHQFFSFFF